MVIDRYENSYHDSVIARCVPGAAQEVGYGQETQAAGANGAGDMAASCRVASAICAGNTNVSAPAVANRRQSNSRIERPAV